MNDQFLVINNTATTVVVYRVGIRIRLHMCVTK